MGRLVVTEFVSIDGVFEDPGGAEGYEYGGWTFQYDRGEDGDRFKLDELMQAQVQLFGRVTYDGFAAAWPSREGPFADKLNNDPKYVVTTTLKDPAWQNTPIISGEVVDRISALKDEIDGVILVAGSGTLVRDAARRGSGRRATADGVPDDPRPRQAAVPRRHRPAQTHPRRKQDRGRRRRPGARLQAGGVGEPAGAAARSGIFRIARSVAGFPGLRPDGRGNRGHDLCFPATASLLVQVSGCTDSDGDFDGVPYRNNWPGTGSTVSKDAALHPTSVVLSSPLTNGSNYQQAAFEADLPRIERSDFGGTCNGTTGAIA